MATQCLAISEVFGSLVLAVQTHQTDLNLLVEVQQQTLHVSAVLRLRDKEAMRTLHMLQVAVCIVC